MLGLGAACSRGSAGAPALSAWLPPEAVLAVEISQPELLLNPILSQEFSNAVVALPGWQAKTDTAQFRQLTFMVQLAEIQLRCDWRTALRRLTSGGIGFGLGPAGTTLLAVDAQDKEILEQLNKTVMTMAGGASAKAAARSAPVEYHGVNGWSLGPKEAHAIVENRLLISNDPETLKRAVDLRADAKAPTLAGSAAYQEAGKAIAADAIGKIFIDLRALKQTPKFKKALTDSRSAMSVLLGADVRNALDTANWLAIGIGVKGGHLTFQMVTDGKAAKAGEAAGFATPARAEDGIWPNLKVEGGIAAATFYRDLHGFYAGKDELFPERTSGLIFFENMMGIYFSGLNLAEEVLAETHPEIRLVVARQRYGELGTPNPQVPAFAVIFRLKHPQQFGEVVEEAWQKALGMYNFTSGQKAQPGMVIDREPYRDGKISVAAFRKPRQAGGSLDVGYNFRPSLAQRGEYLIMSSTDQLTKQLIDALDQEKAGGAKACHEVNSLIEIEGSQLEAILSANRENLVRQNMVEKGHSQEQAEEDVSNILILAQCMNHASLSLGTEQGRPQAKLDFALGLPNVKGLPKAQAESKTQTASSTPR